jgi:hypothetical protein
MMNNMRSAWSGLRLAILAVASCGFPTLPKLEPADAAPPDAPAPLALDCNTYCMHLAADCMGPNAQITMANCMGTCMQFPLGTQADTSGHTLGCRNYYLQAIEVQQAPPATHCPHAGPIGSTVAATAGVCGMTACDDFCAIQTRVCGTDAVPITGVTNRYTDLNACRIACATFATIPEASPTVSAGNSFACRVYHLTNAAAQTTAASLNLHCGHTLVSVFSPSNQATVGPCFQ